MMAEVPGTERNSSAGGIGADDIEVVAHRGLTAHALENTLEAIREAVAAGFATVEIDVRITADGIPVLMHDADLSRLWNTDRTVAASSLDQLREAAPLEARFAASRVPTLEDALDTVAPGRLLIDLPDAPTAQATAVFVRDRAADPDLPAPAFCGAEEAMRAVRAALPDAEIWLTVTIPELPSAPTIETVRPRSVNPYHGLVDPAYRDTAVQRGLAISCWTVDDPARAGELADLGVRAIISNTPTDIRRALQETAR